MIVLAEMVNIVCFATIILLHSCWCYDNSMRTCLFHRMDYFFIQKKYSYKWFRHDSLKLKLEFSESE